MKNDVIVNERAKTELLTSDFYYDLPEELIAQSPSEKRDMCRLMVMDKKSGELSHRIFRDILEYIRPEDMLVVNSSKVIPARLLGKTEKTGSAPALLASAENSSKEASASNSPVSTEISAARCKRFFSSSIQISLFKN